MTINQTAKGTQVSVPGLTPSVALRAHSVVDSKPVGDAVQLTRLAGVLNVFQTNAVRSTSRIDRLSPMVRTKEYSISSVELSRKLMAEMVQKQ